MQPSDSTCVCLTTSASLSIITWPSVLILMAPEPIPLRRTLVLVITPSPPRRFRIIYPPERPLITPAKFLLHVRSYSHSFHEHLLLSVADLEVECRTKSERETKVQMHHQKEEDIWAWMQRQETGLLFLPIWRTTQPKYPPATKHREVLNKI